MRRFARLVSFGFDSSVGSSMNPFKQNSLHVTINAMCLCTYCNHLCLFSMSLPVCFPVYFNVCHGCSKVLFLWVLGPSVLFRSHSSHVQFHLDTWTFQLRTPMTSAIQMATKWQMTKNVWFWVNHFERSVALIRTNCMMIINFLARWVQVGVWWTMNPSDRNHIFHKACSQSWGVWEPDK